MEDVARTTMENDELSIGSLIDSYVARKNACEDLSAQLKAMEAEKDAIEYKILTAMEDAGIDRTGNSKATVTRKVDLYGKITDMAAFMGWCVANGRPDMVQKRISDPAFREVYTQQGEYPPGTDGFMKAKITITRRK